MRLGGGGFRAAGTEALAILDGGRVIASCGSGRFYLWDAATGRQIREFDRARYSGKRPLAASPDGKLLATTDAERKVLLWKAATGEKWRSLEPERVMHIWQLAFAPDGKSVAIFCDWGIRVLDIATGNVVASLDSRSPQAMAFSPDGKTLAVGGTDSTVRVWRVGSTAEPRLLGTLSRSVGAVAFSPDGRTVAAAGGYYPYERRREANTADSAIILWDAATGKERRRCVGHTGAVLDLAFSPDGRLLASAGENSPVRLWDPTTGKQVRACGGAGSTVSALAFMPDGKTLVSAGGTIHLWDVATGRERFASEGHDGAVRAVAFTPDGKTVVSRGADEALCFWDRATGKQLRKVSGVGRGGCLAVTPDGKIVITGGYDTIVRLWDVATGKEVRQLRGHRGLVDSVAVSAKGKLLASAGGDFRVMRNGRDDFAIRIWNLATGKELGRVGDHHDLVRAVCFAPDDKTLASASTDGTTRLWDLATGEEIRRFGDRADNHAILFSPDGQTLATLGGNRIRLWDPHTSKERGQVFIDVPDGFTAMDFSPDGRLLAAGTDQGAIRLWDVDTRRELAHFAGHRGWVAALQFSPDGRVLLSGGADGGLLVWGMTGKLRPTTRLPRRDVSPVQTSPPPLAARPVGARPSEDMETSPSPPTAAVRRDRQGDRLPPGALARIGTVRWQVPDLVTYLACTPDGKTLISAGYRIFLWDTATGRERRRLGRRSNTMIAAALTPDGKRLAYSDDGGRIHLYDVAAGKDLRTFREGRQVHALAFAPDGRNLAVAAEGSDVVIWDVTTGKPARSLPSAPTATDDVAWSRDGKMLAAVGRDQVLRIWRAADGKELHRLRGFAWRVAFAPNGKTLAALTPDNHAELVDVTGGRAVARFGPVGFVSDWCRVVFSPDGRRLFVTPGLGGPGRVWVWETASGDEVPLLPSRQSEVIALAFSPDRKVLYGGGRGNEIQRWDAQTGKELIPEGGHLGVPRAVALSADGGTVVTVGEDWVCRRRDATTGRELSRFTAQRTRCHGALLTPDGSRLATVDVVGENRPAFGIVATLLVWDVATGKVRRQFNLGGQHFHAPRCFSADGRLLVSGDSQGPVTVWDLDTGRLRAEVKGQAGFVLAFGGLTAISPDGTLLAAPYGGRNDSIVLMDPATGTEVRRIGLWRGGHFWQLLFSADGRTLVASDEDVHVWEAVTGEERCSFPGARRIALSGDGRLLATGEAYGTIDLWNIVTGRKVIRFAGQDSGIENLAFSADGRRLVSTSVDQTIVVWAIPASVEDRAATRLSGRELAGLWTDLADEDAFRANRAQRRLLTSPGQAVNYLKDRLRPVGRPDEIASAEQVRVWRAVELLEHIRTPDARRVLRALAGPAPQGRLPREAAAALDRLEKRATDKP
jgi:WD40 repeat protein